MNNWKKVNLGDICEIKIGGTPRRDVSNFWEGGNNQWVSVSELNGGYIYDTKEKITDKGVEGSNVKLIPKDNILLSFKLSVGKIACSGINLYTNEAIAAIIPKYSFIDKRYLFYVLPLIAKKGATSGSMGAGNLNSGKIRELKIPLPYKNDEPDLEMQGKVADKLDKIFLETNEAIEQIRIVQENSNKILESKLQNVFGNKDGNLTEINLENICDTTSGGTPNRSNKTYYNNGEIPWLKSGELNDNENITKSEEFISVEGLKKSNAKIFSKGTILLAMYGATAGKLGILGINASTNQAVCAIKPKKGVNNKYIFWFLKFHRNILIKKAFGGAQPNINQGMIKKIPILIPLNDNKPDIKRQKEISKKLDLIQKQVIILLKKYQEQKRSLILFKQSILQQAFIGELVKVKEPKISLFPIQQAIASILQRGFRRGEMVIAKVLYIGQEIYNVPLNINFSPQNFGPYDSTVKKAITAGASKYNNFFARQPYGKGCVYSLGSDAHKILKYSNSQVNMKMQYFLNEMMPVIGKADSPSIERLATVCKIIQDNKTIDEVVVNDKMQEWKPGKFKSSEVNKSLNFIESKGWDKILIK